MQQDPSSKAQLSLVLHSCCCCQPAQPPTCPVSQSPSCPPTPTPPYPILPIQSTPAILPTPNRPEPELKEIRAFKEAAHAMLAREDRREAYDLRLARYYMWAQTDMTVYVACRVPTGAFGGWARVGGGKVDMSHMGSLNAFWCALLPSERRKCRLGGQAAGGGVFPRSATPMEPADCSHTPISCFLSLGHPGAGYEDRQLVVECSQAGLLVQSEDSPPLIDRALDYGVDTSRPVEVLRWADVGRVFNLGRVLNWGGVDTGQPVGVDVPVQGLGWGGVGWVSPRTDLQLVSGCAGDA